MFKRIATAFVLVVIVAAVLAFAPVWLFNCLILLMTFGALFEYYNLVFKNDYFAKASGIFFGLIVAGALIFFGFGDFVLPLIVGLFFLLTLLHMAYYTSPYGAACKLGLVMFGTFYLCMTLPVISWLRVVNHGRFLIVLSIAIVALGDSFAYAAGNTVGRHKMSPLISPKKTYEGLVASFAGGIVASLVCWQVFWKELPVGLMIFLGASVALIGALGDLVESFIKRAYHVKDSGSVLPGHGGILDRIDALVFAVPFVYFVFKYSGLI